MVCRLGADQNPEFDVQILKDIVGSLTKPRNCTFSKSRFFTWRDLKHSNSACDKAL